MIRSRFFRPLFFLINFFYSVFSALSVTLVMPLVNLLFGTWHPPAGISLPTPAPGPSALILICSLALLAFVLKNLCYVGCAVAASQWRTEMTRQRRQLVLDELWGSRLDELKRAGETRWLHASERESERYASVVVSFWEILFRQLPLILFFTGVLLFISWELTALALIVAPVSAGVYHRLRRHGSELPEQVRRASLGLMSDMKRKLEWLKWIRMHRSEAHETRVWNERQRSWTTSVLKKDRFDALAIAAVEMAGVTGGIGLMVAVGMLALDGRFALGPGGFVLFICAVFSLIDPIKHIARLRTLRNEIRNTPSPRPQAISSPTEFRRFAEFRHQLSLLDVSFGYDRSSRPLFDRLDLTIQKGEAVAVTGPSGIGKSSLVDLLTGVVPPDHGFVRIDGLDLREILPEDLGRVFGVMTQEVPVWYGTLRENLTYDGSFEDRRLIETLERVRLKEWFDKLERGLDTVIGDRGETISGGERQRVAIARLILRRPEIVILDEPAAALDPETEAEIYKTVFELFSGRTIVIVSHRLVKQVHRTLVLPFDNPQPNGYETPETDRSRRS